jgi:hypothetical protein
MFVMIKNLDEDFRTWFVDQVDGKADNPKDKLLAIFDVIGEWMETYSNVKSSFCEVSKMPFLFHYTIVHHR